MRPAKTTPRFACLVAIVGLFAGCTASSVTERHYFAAYGENGETNFYRVTVSARSHNSKADYRSGHFPADAVDAVFGEVSGDTDPQKRVDELRRSVNRAAERYGKLLADGESAEEQVAAAGRNYQRAIDALEQERQERGDGYELDKKFVFVYSTDPGAVIQSIKDFLDQQELSRTLANLFQASVLKDAMVAKERFGMLTMKRNARKGVLDEVKKFLDGLTLDAAEVPDAAALRRLAWDTGSLVGNLRVVAEVAK